MNYRTILLLVGWVITLTACHSSPSSVLKKAMQMENVSVDSIFFYLQQIDKPENLSSKSREIITFYPIKQLCGKPGNQ